MTSALHGAVAEIDTTVATIRFSRNIHDPDVDLAASIKKRRTPERQRTTTVLGSRGAPNMSRCDGGCRPSSSVIP
jgi:hypothetical protein